MEHNSEQNKLVQAIKNVAASALIAAITLVFLGVGLKACEAEQAMQLERAKAHQEAMR